MTGIRQYNGLSTAEAQARLSEYGLNQFSKPARISFLEIAREEITEPLILLLLAVGFFYSIWGKLEDALTIFAIILILVLVEIWNEYRAKKAISALSTVAAPTSKVVRDGAVVEVATELLVPGDLQVLSSGTRIGGDGKLVTSYGIQIDESSLTGESVSIEKTPGDEAYAGTMVIYGEGQLQIQATGRNTRLGKISAFAQKIKEPKTPLQLAMKTLARNLVWIALFFSLIIPILGLLRGQDLQQMILTGLALSFATIPEEGPIIVTLILGLGAYQLSKKNFLVKRTRAAEVLGSATIILTDKTGTITESRMQVVAVFPQSAEPQIIATAFRALTVMSLSPTDKVILEKAKELNSANPPGELVRQRPFGDGRKTKSVIRRSDGQYELVMLGAPEEVFDTSRQIPQEARAVLVGEAGRGRRIIGLASKTISDSDLDLSWPKLERDLDFLGLISLEDPPRPGVKDTIERAGKAGIRTIMVTGDHPETAAYIAKNVGIESGRIMTGTDLGTIGDPELRQAVKNVSVFARTTPQDKYRLVNALQANDEIVAVTGDGINDTLALKAANIGIAMGIRGTDAAKEAADAVLADDNYVTITTGIFEGRKFFDNLRKGFRYYLSAKTALVLVFLLPVLVNIPFPFAPIQIIVLELFMDLAASSAFVAEPAEPTIYTRPPRDPKKKLFDRQLVRQIAVSGLSLFTAVIVSYLLALRMDLPVAETRTFAFSAWILGHIFLAFVSRSDDVPLTRIGFLTNRIMVIWGLAAIAFLLLAIAVPAVNSQLKLGHISLGNLAVVTLISFVAIFWREIIKYRRRN
ncbi:MAG: cation-transporting P-type ATPase [Dehalogenimonas sp.]